MAISTNDGVDKFGTQDEVTSSSGAVTDGSLSASGDIDAWTNDDDAQQALAVLVMQYSTGTIDGDVHMYGRKLNVDGGTTDEAQPDASHQATYYGTFNIDTAQATSSDVAYTIPIVLQNVITSQQYEFEIENESGVTMAAGWNLYITPKAIGPA